METVCKNCNTVFEGNYCNTCGQKADTHKLDFHFLWHDIQHGLFHYDNGILYSFKELYTRPGHTIREYIEGKRVKHFKPISLLIILATLYVLLNHLFHITSATTHNDTNLINDKTLKIIHWISNHFSWVTLATIPIYTLGTSICFKNQNYNFIEYFILNVFKACQRLFLNIAFIPILLFFFESKTNNITTLVTYTISLLLGFWTNIQFFQNLPKKKIIWLSFLSHLIFLLFLLVILIIVIKIF